MDFALAHVQAANTFAVRVVRMTRPAQAVWLLGVTQIIGYGTLYYGFSILADDIAASFGISQAGFFGVFSLSLLAGALVAPMAGRALDRYGAAGMMTFGSAVCGVAVAACAVSSNVVFFALALVVMQMATALTFYDAAFAAIVSLSPADGPKRIVHLTLIAGFASSIFWPVTSFLDDAMGWRAVLSLYGAANILVCLPLHALLFRLSTTPRIDFGHKEELPQTPPPELPPEQRGRAMVLVTLGFSLSSFALSAVLSQMVPMLMALGFGGAALAVATLFGPAQVAVRFTNLLFGRKRHPLTIAIIALALLPLALVVVALAAPAPAGAVAFVVLVGLASGLKSIVQGTVPLALFGAGGYGARLGFMASFRYALGALSPFAFSFASELTSVVHATLAFAAIGFTGVVCLVMIARMVLRPVE